jgi:hypothetical protein
MTYMPKRVTGEQLKKVVSTKLSEDDFNMLQSSAKVYYNRNLIFQPTVSHMLRRIVKVWVNSMRKKQNNIANTGTVPVSDITRTCTPEELLSELSKL